MPPGNKHPEPLLHIRVECHDLEPALTAMCAGYELGEWRAQELAKHLLQWLPEFALKYSEWQGLDASNAVELIGKAAQSIYTSDKYQNRGEFGEILLHAIVRQCMGSVPAISKYYFKDSRNDTVKGFDAVHVVREGSEWELWLGEVKFYNDFRRAVLDVSAELEAHLARDYLRGEFAAITNKLDDSWDGADEIRRLLSSRTSLDKIFKRVCIPVLLTYDSNAVRNHSQVCDEYEAAFRSEVAEQQNVFAAKLTSLITENRVPSDIRIKLFLLPLHTKHELVRHMDEYLKKCQGLV